MLLMGRHTLENAQSYRNFLGWNLKGIRETIEMMIYDHQLAVYVFIPIKSMILELVLSLGVLLFSRSNPMAFCE
jgi:hypothetical protein